MNAATIAKRLEKYFAHTKHPIEFAYLFGSVARGQALPFSDVDVAVYLDARANGDPYNLLAPVHSDLVRTLHREDVDVVPMNLAPLRLRYRIVQQGRLVYSRDERLRGRVETELLNRYYDELPWNEEYNHYLDARILAGKMAERTPDMIDTQFIRERLDYMEKRMNQLQRFQQMARQEFLKNEDAQDLGHIEMQTCCEAMADICTHIVAAAGLERPKERRDTPLVLSRAGILPHNLGVQLAEAIGMRNTLVHAYFDIDFVELHRAIQADLGYFREFGEHIMRYIQKVEKREHSKKKQTENKKIDKRTG